MKNLQPQIRNAVRAVIVQDKKILTLVKSDSTTGIKYSLPGGGQEVGESLVATLTRECKEEIDADVKIVKLLHVTEFYKQKSTTPPITIHTVDFVFLCEIDPDYIPHNGPSPDKRQTNVVWVELSKLASVNLSPPYVKDIFPLATGSSNNIYIDSQVRP